MKTFVRILRRSPTIESRGMLIVVFVFIAGYLWTFSQEIELSYCDIT